MATLAQKYANRRNAQLSTGPKTPEGKAAVAQNRTTHGLTGAFRVLPCEDQAEFQDWLDEYIREYEPATPTERFLVNELAQSQWRIQRADAIEAELLSPRENSTYADIAATLNDSEAVTRLGRYAASARRAYYKAQARLEALRRGRSAQVESEQRDKQRDFDRSLKRLLDAPPPGMGDGPVGVPMPPSFAREVDELRQQRPGFDPNRDTELMSPHLRRWYAMFKEVGS